MTHTRLDPLLYRTKETFDLHLQLSELAERAHQLISALASQQAKLDQHDVIIAKHKAMLRAQQGLKIPNGHLKGWIVGASC